MTPARIARNLLLAAVGGVLVAAGFLVGRITAPPRALPIEVGQQKVTEKAAEVWTCPMHPQIRQPKPGKCPICFMDLIPVNLEHTDSTERQISFSPETVKLLE